MVTRSLGTLVLLGLPCASLCSCTDLLDIEQKEQVPVEPSVGPRPPPRPSTAEVGLPKSIAVALSKYYFGAIDPDSGELDVNAWRRIGFDIDGVNTTAGRALSDSPGTCKANAGAPEDVLVDGEDGRDNNFGSQILKLVLLKSELHTAETGANDGIARGEPTLIAALADLNEGPDDPEVRVDLWVSAPGPPPSWNGEYAYPIDPRTVHADSGAPLMAFRKAYMADNVVVTGEVDAPSETPLLIPLSPGPDLEVLTPLAYTLTFELDDAHERVLGSTLSMVLTVSDQAKLFRWVAILWSLSPCNSGPLLQAFLEPLADLRSGLPGFLDALGSEYCDATSMAMRLGWERVKFPLATHVAELQPGSGSCSD